MVEPRTTRIIAGAAVAGGAALAVAALARGAQAAAPAGDVDALDPRASFGTIRSADGSASYTLTGTDLLWAARMLTGEGGGRAEALWTMAQRKMLPEWRRVSFATMLQGFSQPINPKWLPTGICCAAGATGCPARPSRSFFGQESCSPARLARRARIRALPWTAISRSIRQVVLAWASGRVQNPVPRAVDFASPGLSRRAVEAGRFALVKVSGNWFLSTAESAAWPKSFVQICFLGGCVGEGGVGSFVVPVVLVAGVAIGGFVLLRRAGVLGDSELFDSPVPLRIVGDGRKPIQMRVCVQPDVPGLRALCKTFSVPPGHRFSLSPPRIFPIPERA